MDINNIWIYRILSVESLEEILQSGTYCKRTHPADRVYPTIGNKEIIGQRDRMPAKCYPGTVVNDYVPFYFSVRTPMLYNVITGVGVEKRPQREIIYTCYKLAELATADHQWCYTNGNAAKKATLFYTNLDTIETNIDWRSIKTTDFRDNNADGDEDRVRKKHAEFLVRSHVPSTFMRAIVVLNKEVENTVKQSLTRVNLNIPVFINPKNKFYF